MFALFLLVLVFASLGAGTPAFDGFDLAAILATAAMIIGAARRDES